MKFPSNQAAKLSSFILLFVFGFLFSASGVEARSKFVDDDGTEKIGKIISAWHLKEYEQRCYTIRIPSDGREFERIYSLDINKVEVL